MLECVGPEQLVCKNCARARTHFVILSIQLIQAHGVQDDLEKQLEDLMDDEEKETCVCRVSKTWSSSRSPGRMS